MTLLDYPIRSNRRHQIVTFADAGHAFFNDTGQRFHPPSAAEAWHRTLDWFVR